MIPKPENVLGQAQISARAGRWEEARELFGKAAVETSPLAHDHSRVADARRWCSIAGMRLGDWDRAAHDARLSLATSTALADVRREARSLNVAGAVEFERGDWETALAFFAKARSLARSAADRLLLAKIDNNEGALWDARGIPVRARQLFASAIAGFRSSDQPIAAARAMNNLGVSLANGGAAGEALHWYREAASTARQAGEEDLLLTVLINLARAEVEIGDLRHARVAVAEARTLAARMEGDPTRADLGCTLAAIARVEGRWLEAEEWIALVLQPSMEGRNPLATADAWEQRARLCIDQGRIEEARHAIEQAGAVCRKLGAKTALARLEELAFALPREEP